MSGEKLREKCPNTEFFLVRIFSHSYCIRNDTPYFSVFSPNAGKYRPEKTPYLDTFHAMNGCQSNWKKTTQSWNSFAEQITVFRCSLRTLLCNASIQSHTLIMPAMSATQLKIKLEATTKRPVLHWYYYYL